MRLKSIIRSAALGTAALLTAGCVAVPYDSYYGDGYYYPAPAVSGTIVYHDYDNRPRYRDRYYHDDRDRYRHHRHHYRDRDRGRAWQHD